MAGLQEQSIPVPLLGLNEKAPSKAGPFGRLTKAVNVVVNKFSGDGSNFQADKRPGFHSLSTALYNPYGGTAPTGTLPEAVLASKLGEVSFIIGVDGTPYVYSPASEKWAKFDNETIIANKITTSPVKMDTSTIKNNDSASIGSSHCHVWTDQTTGAGYAEFVDDNGTFIRSPFVAAAKSGSLVSGVRIKVAADEDENVFWIVSDNAGPIITVTAYNPASGAAIGAPVSPFAMAGVGGYWDIVVDSDVRPGVFVVTNGSELSPTIGATVATVAMVLGVPTRTTLASNPAIPGDTATGIAFLRAAHDGFLYVATVVAAGGPAFTVQVSKIDTTVTATHTYQVIDEGQSTAPICSLGGYVDNVAGEVHAFAGVLAYTGLAPTANNMINGYTLFGYATATSDFQGLTRRRSVIPTSRAFMLNGIPCLIALYTSVPTFVSEVNGAVQQGNPTFFVLRADTGAVIGRLFSGQAAGNAVWQTWDGMTAPIDGYHLSSPRDAVDGGIVVALPVTGSQSIARARENDGPFVDTFTTSIGIRDIKFGSSYGSCIECESETLIPGALPRTFDGQSFGAAGIELTPEQPVITDSSTPGPWNVGDARSYVIVYERLNRSGNKVYSPSSISLQYQIGSGANRSASLAIPTLRATTHDDVIISVYRTIMLNGQQGLTHYKITSDQSPIFNDPTVDTVTFVDSVDDSSASLGQILYGGSGSIPSAIGGGDGQEIDHECAAAFNSGTVFGDRSFLSAYDNAVWFSLPGQAGSSLAFSSAFRMTIPTKDAVTALDALDRHLVILCARSIWTTDQASYLDATGAGDIPTPYQLKISNGSTGAKYAFKDGIIYASSAEGGGFYLLTRDLDSQYIGAPIEDDVNGHSVLDVAVDDSQRVYFLLDDTSSSICVFDIVSRTWSLWQIGSTFVARLAVHKGKIAACSTSGAFKVLSPGSYDDDGSPIISQIRIADISVAGVPGCQLIWQVILIGTSYSDHQLFVDFIPDGKTTDTEVFGPIVPSDFGVGVGDEYRSFIEPAQMETSSFGIEIHDFLTVPGRGLSLQMLGLSVGIMPGTRKPSVGRIGDPR